MMISWFLGALGKRRPDFFMRKQFLGFLLSFFINYVAMSAFYLRGKSFNEDRNHHQYIIVTALMNLAKEGAWLRMLPRLSISNA